MPKKETKILIASLFFINILSISIFIYLLNFTKNQIVESVKKEDDIKKELKKEDAIVLMKDDLILGKMYQEKLMRYIIPNSGTVDFIKTLEQMASTSRVKSNIKNIVNENYDKGNTIGLELLKVNIDINGEWKNIQLFLTSLENYPLKIDIKKISFNKLSDDIIKGKNISQWSGNIEFTIVKLKKDE